ncbi:MAG: AAA family ATPase [Acidimicrobiales bacterium]
MLATLQPDQYELVTWPSDEPLIVQGQPGTGKTVVATHRAAYLTHAERKPRPLSRVALIGPTDQYADHVRSVQDEIGGGEVEVVSMPTLMRRLAGVRRVAATSGGDHLDTVWRLGTTLDRCARLLAREGHLEGKPDRDARALVKAFLAAESPFHELLEEDEELDEWRRSVKNRQVAESDGRYLPFLAAARLAVAPISEGDRFDHILVDEAQDLRMLEWRIVSAHLRTGGTMSLFGDINQRHSDWTAASWEQLVSDLELTESDDGIEVSELELGYRSTKQILRYANQLLPRGQRTVHAIQEGPDPVLSKVAKGEVMAEVARSAADLSVRHGSGLVAVISMSPTACSDALRRDGWSRSGTRQGWKKDGCTVVVLDPEMARGLEFDGVVVVEPGDFPMNLGRLGPLYTSLTRATRELVVVHSSGLPRDLRRTR